MFLLAERRLGCTRGENTEIRFCRLRPVLSEPCIPSAKMHNNSNNRERASLLIVLKCCFCLSRWYCSSAASSLAEAVVAKASATNVSSFF